MLKNSFVWGDNWWIEENQAWFVDAEKNLLFEIDLEKNACKILTKIPCDSKNNFRQNPFCIKCDNEIFCIPDNGNLIWTYNLKTIKMERIDIFNPNNKRLSMGDFWAIDNNLYIVSRGLKQILKINIQKKIVEDYFAVSVCSKEKIERSVKVQEDIYIVSLVFPKIYKFNTATTRIEEYTIKNLNTGFYSISYDGIKFWLSGFNREIYLWDGESEEVRIFNSFPTEFGEYYFDERGNIGVDIEKYEYNNPTSPPFLYTVAVGENVWFIPFQTNKIIYVNKDTYEIKSFEIKDDEGMLRDGMSQKYVLECVLNNKIILLYSFKNGWIWEIDTEKMSVKLRSIYIKLKLEDRDIFPKCYREENCLERSMFETHLLESNKKSYDKGEVGSRIYKELLPG